MKRIVIYQEGSDTVELFDDDGSEVPSYTERLSDLFQVGNISVVNTTSGSLAVRPSKITAVLVQDFKEPSQKTPIKKDPKNNKKVEEEVDIITDV
jgi:hypothetical protein